MSGHARNLSTWRPAGSRCMGEALYAVAQTDCPLFHYFEDEILSDSYIFNVLYIM